MKDRQYNSIRQWIYSLASQRYFWETHPPTQTRNFHFQFHYSKFVCWLGIWIKLECQNSEAKWVRDSTLEGSEFYNLTRLLLPSLCHIWPGSSPNPLSFYYGTKPPYVSRNGFPLSTVAVQFVKFWKVSHVIL